MDSALYANYLNILKQELVPALGCTEPIAIAYAAAKARQILGEISGYGGNVSERNIIKNVKGVTVPNSGGLKGIDVAAVLGIVGGNADKALEVLSEVTPKDIALTKELITKKVCFLLSCSECRQPLHHSQSDQKADITLLSLSSISTPTSPISKRTVK